MLVPTFYLYSYVGRLDLMDVYLDGVADSLVTHSTAEATGIKAHFRMDESGLLSLDYVGPSTHGTRQSAMWLFMSACRWSLCLSIQRLNRSQHSPVSAV